ncbi:hypothetical protein DMENIID0001_032470 [Sergentomyia squamirostris]
MAENKEILQYNKDEQNPPEYVNQDLILKVLQNVEEDEHIEIIEFKIVPGTKPGEHFASIMFKAVVSYISRGKQVLGRSFVIKTMPVEEGMKKEMLTKMPIFEREIDMYTKVIPEMSKVMTSIGDSEVIAPSLLYHSLEPPILIFEDITQRGYKMHQDLLDFDKTVRVVKKLAKFHALSYYINDNKYAHRLDLTMYDSILVNKNSINNMKVFEEALEILHEEVKLWVGYKDIASKILALKDTYLNTLLDVFVPNKSAYNVLNHGDLNLKNMMFSFSENDENIDQILFYDFQMSLWASPAIDLIYLLYEIGNAETRQRQGELIFIYHRAFEEYLTRLGCLKNAPTVLTLNIEMLKHAHLEILLGLCWMPFFVVKFTELVQKTEIEPSQEFFIEIYKLIYQQPDVIRVLKELIPNLVNKGVIN